MNKNIVKKSSLKILICIVLYIILVMCTLFIDSKGGMIIHIGKGSIANNSFNGVINALQVLICVILVCIDYKKGFIVSCVLYGITFALMFRTIIRLHVLTPFVGMSHVFISIVTLAILSRFFWQRDKALITDALTQLINRRGMLRVLSQKCCEKDTFDIVYVDIDDFKFINDNLGHENGDYILKTIAKRLALLVDDKGLACRIGGDEFMLIVPAKDDKKAFMNEIINAVAAKIEIVNDDSSRDIYVTTSVGMVRYPEHGNDADSLLKYADLAMFHAKKEGKNKGQIFDDSLANEMIRKSELEVIIKESLDKDYFFLVYQPQFEINNKKLRGFETLIRLKTPDGNMISPGEFIPVAEDSNLITRIDEYVMKRALREFKKLVKNRKESIVLSINMSTKDICMTGFSKKVEEALLEADFPPECLEIEITEYCFAHAMDIAAANIEALKKLGIKIALDDFGTGFASLSYLTKLPIDLLKIDKSFVDNIETDIKSRDFASAVVSIGRVQGCEIISEGVENENQLSVLQEVGCDFVQGYVWSKPLSYEKAIEFCNAN